MRCPKCAATANCIDSRMASPRNVRYRRYECPACETRFSTRELLKSDGPLQLDAMRNRLVHAIASAARDAVDRELNAEETESCVTSS